MVLHASEAPCFPWWCEDMKMYRYDVLIELIDDYGDSINEDYESFSSKKEAIEKIDYINNSMFADWEEYYKGE